MSSLEAAAGRGRLAGGIPRFRAVPAHQMRRRGRADLSSAPIRDEGRGPKRLQSCAAVNMVRDSCIYRPVFKAFFRSDSTILDESSSGDVLDWRLKVGLREIELER